ncbi:hypothetical protein BTUL_0147g00050 [Botrytis tulipae]|uniref:Uncharacterized protein n=1 Tax=Botrytis tulipae TaxID=87230 RepID=A0A4Z1EL42_9HELO|nr:hypothetical protein BTUL_0147g00050 [Botrytis tulipae]
MGLRLRSVQKEKAGDYKISGKAKRKKIPPEPSVKQLNLAHTQKMITTPSVRPPSSVLTLRMTTTTRTT